MCPRTRALTHAHTPHAVINPFYSWGNPGMQNKATCSKRMSWNLNPGRLVPGSTFSAARLCQWECWGTAGPRSTCTTPKPAGTIGIASLVTAAVWVLAPTGSFPPPVRYLLTNGYRHLLRVRRSARRLQTSSKNHFI